MVSCFSHAQSLHLHPLAPPPLSPPPPSQHRRSADGLMGKTVMIRHRREEGWTFHKVWLSRFCGPNFAYFLCPFGSTKQPERHTNMLSSFFPRRLVCLLPFFGVESLPFLGRSCTLAKDTQCGINCSAEVFFFFPIQKEQHSNRKEPTKSAKTKTKNSKCCHDEHLSCKKRVLFFIRVCAANRMHGQDST